MHRANLAGGVLLLSLATIPVDAAEAQAAARKMLMDELKSELKKADYSWMLK